MSQIIDVCCRVDDEWKREAIQRRYFLLQFNDGSDASAYQNPVSGQWHEQRY